MRQISHIIAIIIIALSFNACTHNNGDIGDTFGTWKLQSITIDGETDANYQSNVLWKFQASIVSMVRVDDTTHNHFESWGTWEYADNDTRLLMNFTHTDNDNANPGSAKYSPLPETHLPGGTTFHLDVMTLNGKEMTLRYTSPDGKEYLYKFKKWA
ncbi:MAG: lipocalin-like domain-containing protein [Muribaculaceae bacterium]|nr:lipocalin-like domain-containing protein [Muribaculaceae bacterium]